MRASSWNAQPCGCDRGAAHYCEWHLHDPERRPFMLRVIIESPLHADTREGIEKNKVYARQCMRDSLLRLEAPFLSHLMYEDRLIMDDLKSVEREMGIRAGFEWIEVADLTAVYTDLGVTSGMLRGIEIAARSNRKVVYRTIR
jgi:hypothetical protein